MQPKRILLEVGATILSLATLAPAVAASPRSGELIVTKNCSTYTGAAGDSCSITSSNHNAIKVGSKVFYSQAADFGSLTLNSDIVIDGPGSERSAFRQGARMRSGEPPEITCRRLGGGGGSRLD